MATLKLLNTIYNSRNLATDIFCHYNAPKKISPDKLTRNEYMKMLMNNHIDLYPVILLDYFDTLDIKIAVYPVEGTEFWSSRVHYEGVITINNHYTSRLDAVSGGIEKGIEIYETNNLYEKQRTKKV